MERTVTHDNCFELLACGYSIVFVRCDVRGRTVTTMYSADEFFNRKKPTNADRIRAMSDEELAELPWEYDFQCYMCPNKPLCDDGYKTCKELWLDWLQQEVEE